MVRDGDVVYLCSFVFNAAAFTLVKVPPPTPLPLPIATSIELSSARHMPHED